MENTQALTIRIDDSSPNFVKDWTTALAKCLKLIEVSLNEFAMFNRISQQAVQEYEQSIKDTTDCYYDKLDELRERQNEVFTHEEATKQLTELFVIGVDAHYITQQLAKHPLIIAGNNN